ncbi:unnamed protein product [Prorocentrum cordatum]|uniref:UmuC domain-containing protein n=1 Tax=Prorocentrum cordatum TaxID=2364126 RepID=A0ABN9Q7H2_9DINO|nr:unnamed protein product [Polarella glacialis]
MVTTANYVARLYGVRSAMPGFIAQEMVRSPHLVGSKMPPDELVFIRPDFGKYTRAARETREVFREYDPNFHAGSLDEAYLDLTDYLAGRGGAGAAEEVVHELRRRVKERTGGLTCSAGIGPNPISVMLGVRTCSELAAAMHSVRRAFATRPKTCLFLARISLGLSGREVGEEEGEEVGCVERKSLSSERTFAAEAERDQLLARLGDCCRGVAEQMASSVPPLACKVVALKTKTSTFVVRNRQVTCRQFLGFDVGFASRCPPGNRGRPEEDLGPGTAFRRDEVPGASAGAGAAPPAGEPLAETPALAEDAAYEAEVSRVAGEMYSVLSAALEEQMPCSLRLLGVRVSAFRGQKASLGRGQRQLASFFAAKGSGRAGASGLPEGRIAAAMRSQHCEAVVDIAGDSDGAEHEEWPSERPAGACAPTTACLLGAPAPALQSPAAAPPQAWRTQATARRTRTGSASRLPRRCRTAPLAASAAPRGNGRPRAARGRRTT